VPHLQTLKDSKKFSVQVYASILLFGLTALCLQGFSQIEKKEETVVEPLKGFPLALTGWKGAEGDLGDGIVDVLGLEDWLMRRYQGTGGEGVWFYVGYLGPWDVGKKRQAYHSPQFCYPAQGWDITENSLQQVPVGGGKEITINKLIVQNGLQRQLILYWFQHGNKIAPEGQGADFKSKIAWIVQLPFMLMGDQRTDRTLVRVSSTVGADVDEALDRQIKFIQAAFPAIDRHFQLDISAS
jgi:EpsI family protein